MRRPLSALAAALFAAPVAAAGAPSTAAPQAAPPPAVAQLRDSVTINMADADLRLVVQALSPYVDRPVVFGIVPQTHVTLQTPRPVPRADVVRLLRGVVESQGLELAVDSAAGMYRVRAKEAPKPVVDPNAPRPAPSAAPAGPPELFTIHLQHARATDVAATVNALYGRGTALGENQFERGAGSTLPQTLQQNVVPPQPLVGQSNMGGAAAVARAASFSGETVIIPDQSSNTLLIRANEHDFALIQAAVKELDVRPLQVLIEVLIAEVSRNSRFELGIGGNVPNTGVRAKGVDGVSVSGVMGGGAVADSTLGDFVLHILKRGGGVNLTATITAAAARGEAHILSRPVVIAANGETAEILVGSQRPFVQVQRSLATETATRDQVVQYKDVGTRLTVKPTISGDGYVMLAVTQEVNQATAEVQFDAPVISTRTVQTQLLVRDSQTVVLGGLSDRQRDNTRSGIPILSQIPLIGGLFGGTQRQTNETEFFLFITPRVIRTDADADALSAPLRKRTGNESP